MSHAPLDKRRLRLSFAHAADSYDAAAVLQREIAERMLARLDLVRRRPAHILDIGCGTGYDSQRLMQRYPTARLVCLDIAEAMVRRSRRRAGLWRRLLGRARFLAGDAERLPVASGRMDLVISNATLQWCDAPAVFREVRRVLRPGGLFMFSTFGPDTLRELRAAWRAADDAPHVHAFIDMHDLGDLLVQSGFADPVMDMETFTLTYDDVIGVMRDIKHLGAHNAAQNRVRGLTGKTRFGRFRSAYEALARDGKIPATYEAVYGHAWVPESGTEPARDGIATVPLGRIGRRAR